MRKKAGIAIGSNGNNRAMLALGKLAPSGATSKRKMREMRRLDAGRVENQNVLERVGEMILPADNVADAEIGVIGAGGQMIRRRAVAAQKREVLDIGGGFRLLAVDAS